MPLLRCVLGVICFITGSWDDVFGWAGICGVGPPILGPYIESMNVIVLPRSPHTVVPPAATGGATVAAVLACWTWDGLSLALSLSQAHVICVATFVVPITAVHMRCDFLSV